MPRSLPEPKAAGPPQVVAENYPPKAHNGEIQHTKGAHPVRLTRNASKTAQNTSKSRQIRPKIIKKYMFLHLIIQIIFNKISKIKQKFTITPPPTRL
jgi:hypothetical protein